MNEKRNCITCGKEIKWKWEDFDWNDGREHHDCEEMNCDCYCRKCMDCAENKGDKNGT